MRRSRGYPPTNPRARVQAMRNMAKQLMSLSPKEGNATEEVVRRAVKVGRLPSRGGGHTQRSTRPRPARPSTWYHPPHPSPQPPPSPHTHLTASLRPPAPATLPRLSARRRAPPPTDAPIPPRLASNLVSPRVSRLAPRRRRSRRSTAGRPTVPSSSSPTSRSMGRVAVSVEPQLATTDSWPPRTAAGGLRLPSALDRSDPSPRIAPRGRSFGARGRPS